MLDTTMFRQKYHLRQDPSCGDLPATVFCGPCKICQEARELESRGNSSKFISTNTLFQRVSRVVLETEQNVNFQVKSQSAVREPALDGNSPQAARD
ncbi:unnamed protein product [Rotaria magnacalcarata]|uniref:Uncharacterized protein n=1 Tax=Rotaria magnacalcarata TaxID=392030 RepID=A0A816R4K4_9BILA|nr:unnamed protein product [Rotaria magnacalcarata]CAF1936367.1 unnamed protein product [Rotaria magnacalcarata]CAF2066844.1 unnamed protein product [Rotaria magnacalcarata]